MTLGLKPLDYKLAPFPHAHKAVDGQVIYVIFVIYKYWAWLLLELCVLIGPDKGVSG